jgi:flavorubredoxin
LKPWNLYNEETTMQVLVLYHSKGGNTRKLAENIASGVEAGNAPRMTFLTLPASLPDHRSISE